MTSEKVFLAFAQCADSDSPHACAVSHLGISSPLIYFVVPNDSVGRERNPRSDSAYTQSFLGIHCPQMLEDTFLYICGSFLHVID